MLRMYSGAKASRLTAGFGTSNTSADSELVSSLIALRSRSRQLIRDAGLCQARAGDRAEQRGRRRHRPAGGRCRAVARRAQPARQRRHRGRLARLGARRSPATPAGRCILPTSSALVMGEVFEAGEVFIRMHYGQVRRVARAAGA
ncbi:MAG: hypothetical protein MZW92_31790 [Comamonadaceae bacterium]|nr:hypothetical protein [Comamonadaceae bacterium]